MEENMHNALYLRLFIVFLMLTTGLLFGFSCGSSNGENEIDAKNLYLTCDCTGATTEETIDSSNSGMPTIGETAPSFVAETSQGVISFPEDYQGKWVILFSHPADFTPVCTTEMMTFAFMEDEFDSLNTKLVGLSVDSKFSHIGWIRSIRESIEFNGMSNISINFPIIADVNKEVSIKYGMIQDAASSTEPVRAVFFIDPQAIIRAIIYYPLSNGRNFAEIKRILIAMQTVDAHQVATPADWQPGDEVIVPPPGSFDTAASRVQEAGEGYRCEDWYFCVKSLEIDPQQLSAGAGTE